MDLDNIGRIDSVLRAVEQLDFVSAVIFLIIFLLVWFLPTIIAGFFNRKHFYKILIANVPAGLSFVAWAVLIGWAFTGKMKNPRENDKDTELSSSDKNSSVLNKTGR